MDYFEMFTGVAGFSVGIEKAYGASGRQNRNGQADIRLSGRCQTLDGTGNDCSQGERSDGRIDLGTRSEDFATGPGQEQGRIARDGANCEQFGLCKQQPTCIGFSEIARVPCGILRYRYPNVRNFGNASDIIPNINRHGTPTNTVPDELPDFDFLCGGFPCQDFSIAGKRQGIDGARGTLFYEIARVLSHKRPGHFLLENVKGLLSSDNGQTYPRILRVLADLDYRVETVVLNSKHYGVPQNRERVFFIGHLGERCSREILSFGNGDREVASSGSIEPISGTISTKNQSGQCQFDGSTTLIYGKDGKQKNQTVASTFTAGAHSGGNHSDMDLIVVDARARQDGSQQPIVAIPVLTPDRPTKRQNGRRMKDEGEARFTLTSADRHGVMLYSDRATDSDHSSTLKARNDSGRGRTQCQTGVVEQSRIRRLTPTECARLQGFPDSWADLGLFQNKQGEWHVREISDTGKYQVFGNAVTTNVIEAIIGRMLEVGCLE